jgi:hypothetical protein
MNDLNGTEQIPPNQPMNLKRNVIPVPGGIKVIYNFIDGTFAASVDIYAPANLQNSIPSLVMDLAKALNSRVVQPSPEDVAKFIPNG